MSLRLVFVHGIGAARRADEECARWSAALAEGFRRSGHSDLADRLAGGRQVDVHFCHYGDLFTPGQAQGAGAAPLGAGEAQILVELLTETVEEHLAEVSQEQVRAQLLAARAQLRPPGPAQGAGDLLRRAINAATTLLGIGPLRRSGQWVSAKFLVGDLAQVARYLARGEHDASGATLDARIRARVRAAFGDGPVIAVTHSLGTVVGLEALHEYTGEVPLLVTLGSPIAMRTVVLPRLVPQPPRTPRAVRRWLNFWDRDDVVVSRPQLAEDLKPNETGVLPQSARIDSDGLWVHTATKYLSKADVAGPIAETLRRHVSAR